MNPLPPPKTKIAKILHAFATGKVISEQDFRINSFRSILSDLRNDYGIPIRHAKEVSQDEFGKRTWYYRYFTLSVDKKKVQRVYLKINQ
jgi:hypothetical protein